MAIDEAAAYAQASWNRFEHEVSDALLRALCAAFALVAAVDGSIDRRESDRFLETLRPHLAKWPKLDAGRVETLFHALTDAILSDPTGGREQALAEIAAFRGKAPESELVRGVARVAAAADARSDPREHEALAEIERALASSSNEGGGSHR